MSSISNRRLLLSSSSRVSSARTLSTSLILPSSVSTLLSPGGFTSGDESLIIARRISCSWCLLLLRSSSLRRTLVLSLSTLSLLSSVRRSTGRSSPTTLIVTSSACSSTFRVPLLFILPTLNDDLLSIRRRDSTTTSFGFGKTGNDGFTSGFDLFVFDESAGFVLDDLDFVDLSELFEDRSQGVFVKRVGTVWRLPVVELENGSSESVAATSDSPEIGQAKPAAPHTHLHEADRSMAIPCRLQL